MSYHITFFDVGGSDEKWICDWYRTIALLLAYQILKMRYLKDLLDELRLKFVRFQEYATISLCPIK